jgi:flagellar hook-associated protein 2
MRITGFASGLDTEKIISDLMTAQRMRTLNPLTRQKQTLQWKQDGYREINTKYSALKNALFDLNLEASFQSRKTASNNESVLTATASNGSAVGSYSVKVTSLASAAQTASQSALGSTSDKTSLAAQFGLGAGASGSFKINGAEFTYTGTQTLSELVSEVNKASDATGVTMSYDEGTDRVFFRSTATGSAAKIEFEDSADNFLRDKLKLDDGSGNVIGTVTGTNAKIDFNGAKDLEFSSNTFTLTGVSFNLKGTGDVELTVSRNVDGAVEKIKSFVEAYNNLTTHISSLTMQRPDRDYLPLSDDERETMTEEEITNWEAKAKEGLFANDTFLNGMVSSLRSTATTFVSSLSGSAYKTLSAIGISTGAYASGSSANASLNIDEDALRAALEKDPEAVMKVFTGDTAQKAEGLASRMTSRVNGYIQNITSRAGLSGVNYQADGSSMSEQLRNLDSRIELVKERNAKLEERYWEQYSALETAMTQMSSQSDWLSAQLSTLLGSSSSSK